MREPDGRSRRCFLKASSMLGLAAAFMPPTISEAHERQIRDNI
jgi:uncharacterized protein (DUF1501 family)